MTIHSHIQQSGLPDTTKEQLLSIVRGLDHGYWRPADIYTRDLKRYEGITNVKFWYSLLMSYAYLVQAERAKVESLHQSLAQ